MTALLKKGRLVIRSNNKLLWAFTTLLTFSLLMNSRYASAAVNVPPAQILEPEIANPLYLPVVRNPAPRQVLLGVYTDSYLGLQSTIDNEVKAIDTWSGKRLSIVGTFIGFDDQHPDYNIPVPLGLVWDSGYTPFVNLSSSRTLQYINSGNMDSAIRRIAGAFKQWRDEGLTKRQNRRAFVAPFPEMNGDWVSYFGSPGDFKLAYQRVRDIFNQEGASPAVRWAFAPNGWSAPNDSPFEDYYPGDAGIEVVAFSAYNAGYCPSVQWKEWKTAEQVLANYIQRMRVMAPSKPVFVAQTGTTAYTNRGYSAQAKNEWLLDAYGLIADSPGVSGIIYFNMGKNQACDWPFYQLNGSKFDGYRQAVSRSEFIYIPSEALASLPLSP
jgi:hypothetical protein